MNYDVPQIISTGIALVGGLGIGSWLTTYMKDRFERKQFKYKEKLNVYAGYIEALQNSVAESSESNRQKVVYWHQRLKLISTPQIEDLAVKFYAKDSLHDFSSLRDEIVKEMRADLDRSL